MAIHVRHLEEMKRLALEPGSGRPPAPVYGLACARCAELGAAVRVLVAEVERLRVPYARAFRDGADGALDFAGRALGAVGEHHAARVLHDLRAVVKE